jgi:hypothetical protein
MDFELFRAELIEEMLDFSETIKSSKSIFLPEFEKMLAKVELFNEYAQSPTIQHLIIVLQNRIPKESYLDLPLTDKVFLTDLNQLIHFVENVVPAKI